MVFLKNIQKWRIGILSNVLSKYCFLHLQIGTLWLSSDQRSCFENEFSLIFHELNLIKFPFIELNLVLFNFIEWNFLRPVEAPMKNGWIQTSIRESLKGQSAGNLTSSSKSPSKACMDSSSSSTDHMSDSDSEDSSNIKRKRAILMHF